MTIRDITVSNIGPFLEKLTVPLEPRVTIFTGSNDVGKSSLLKAIQLAFTPNATITQDDVNHDYLQIAAGEWTKDASIVVESNFAITSPNDTPGASTIDPKDSCFIRRKVAPDIKAFEHHTRLRHHSGQNFPPSMPVIIRPKLEGSLRNELNLRELLPLEQALLDAAFESRFAFAKFENLADLHYTRAIKKAERTLNTLLARVLPHPGMIRFDLHEIAGDRARLALMVRDRHDGITPFGMRGEGVRKMVTLLGELITSGVSAHHRLVLLDEPENSLHADAQHLLREFLWAMTESGRTQVIYATHSPSMIDPLRPEQVRVLVRERHGETATAKLQKQPTENNFAEVRSTLGLSLADSLLYAPVTIVTEGPTEVRNILPLVRKVAPANAPAFGDAEKLLRLCSFLSGTGDSFELVCRVARAHGALVVLFLDGDKQDEVERQKITEKHPGMPIVFTPGRSEFEQLVPEPVYLRAALEVVGLPFDPTRTEDFNSWSNAQPWRTRMAFSKRVEAWYRETFDPPFQPKPVIMGKAIELASPTEIDAAPILALLQAIRTALNGSSFE